MRVKNTYSRATVHRFTGATNAIQVATAGIEVGGLSLKNGGAGGATVVLYDAKTAGDANPSNETWVLDVGATGNDNQPFPHPLSFKHGVHAVLEQGVGTNPILCVNRIPSEV